MSRKSRSAYQKAWRESNQARVIAYRRTPAAMEANRKRALAFHYSHPDADWERNLWSNYRMTVEDFDKLLKAQEGRCAICGIPESGVAQKRLYVDHCHKTGTIRGLLCIKCNFLLGHGNDDAGLLRRAANYLESL